MSQEMLNVFRGREDVYAEGYSRTEGKLEYAPRYESLTPDVVERHLRGEQPIGVYNLDTNDCVSWFAADFDGDTYDAARAEALEQQRLWDDAGLITYLERSRSGNGVHLWGFLSKPVPASIVRRALRPLVQRQETFDRLYPLQDVRGGKAKLGNLIALPYEGGAVKLGNSMFLDDDGNPVPLEQFLDELNYNTPAILEELAVATPAARTVEYSEYRRPEALPDGLLKLTSMYGCQFVRHVLENRKSVLEPLWYAAVSQTTMFENGKALAAELSRGRPSREGELEAKYENAASNPPVSCAYIREHFPDQACANCRCSAPYKLGALQLTQLVTTDTGIDLVGSFSDDLAEAQRLAQGHRTVGVDWQIPELRKYTWLRNGEMTAVGAQPSRGKTWLMVDAAVRQARAGTPVVIFSAETGARTLRNRLLANVARVDSRVLTGEVQGRPHEWKALEAAAKELETLPIAVDYGTASAEGMLRQLEQLMFGQRKLRMDDPYVVMFDYLQYGVSLTAEQSEYMRVSRLSAELKALTKITDRPVVVFSQVRRETESNETPDLTWFKASGRIEADIDVGLIITGERVQGEYAPRTLTLVKQREGLANIQLNMRLNQTYGAWETYSVRATGSSAVGVEYADAV